MLVFRSFNKCLSCAVFLTLECMSSILLKKTAETGKSPSLTDKAEELKTSYENRSSAVNSLSHT